MTHQRQHAIQQHGHHRRAGRALALDAWRADKTRSRSTNPLPRDQRCPAADFLL